jgi:uncharacterized protein YggE
MRTPGLVLLSTALVLGLAGGVRAQAPNGPSGSQSVVVAEGQAVLMYPPDRAYIAIGADGRADTPDQAQRLSAAAMTSVRGALAALGVTADAVRTTSYSLQPVFDANTARTVRGYVARNVIEVRVDDLARLPAVLDAAGQAGAASVTGVRFDLKESAAAQLDALRQAVRDAKGRAQAMAEGAGRTLGPVLRIEERQRVAIGPRFAPLSAAGPLATPIEPGQVEVRAAVELTIALR